MTRSNESGIIGVGLAVFLGLAIYFIARSGPQTAHFPPLSTMSPRPNGAMALYQLLEATGQPVKQHFDSIYHYPENGTVVVLNQSIPDAATLMTGGLDVKALSTWMKRGGTLVLFASPYALETHSLFLELQEQAASDVHAGDFGYTATDHEQLLTAIGQTPVHAAWEKTGEASTTVGSLLRSGQNGEVYLVEGPPVPLLNTVERLEVAQPEPTGDYLGAPLLTLGDPAQPLVVLAPVGKGQLLWVTAPELASNAWIKRQDNHRLVLQLLRYAAGGEALYFDEFFHGYREKSTGALGLFFQTTGGRLLLGLLALCAAAFAGAAISPARFMPAPVPPRRQSTEMVLAQGNLYQRAGLRRPIALHLLDGLRQAIRQYEHWGTVPDDRRLSHWLRGAAGRGLPVDEILLQFAEGRLTLSTQRQLWLFAQACDRLKSALR